LGLWDENSLRKVKEKPTSLLYFSTMWIQIQWFCSCDAKQIGSWQYAQRLEKLQSYNSDDVVITNKPLT
jgi:hypothetical protein